MINKFSVPDSQNKRTLWFSAMLPLVFGTTFFSCNNAEQKKPQKTEEITSPLSAPPNANDPAFLPADSSIYNLVPNAEENHAPDVKIITMEGTADISRPEPPPASPVGIDE